MWCGVVCVGESGSVYEGRGEKRRGDEVERRSRYEIICDEVSLRGEEEEKIFGFGAKL